MTDLPPDNPTPNLLDLPDLTPIVQAFLFFTREMVEATINPFRQAYRLDGAPYGDTDEGLRRWLDEFTAQVYADIRATFGEVEPPS